MNLEQHYEEETQYITVNGVTPIANSIPLDNCFLGSKFQKIIRKSGIVCTSFMNVAFEKPQAFTGNLIWSLHGNDTDVFIIESKKLFVKGKHYWVYCVGIIE